MYGQKEAKGNLRHREERETKKDEGSGRRNKRHKAKTTLKVHFAVALFGMAFDFLAVVVA